MRDDQRKLDKTRACSNRAGPRYLSGEDASVTLTSNHEGHATGQRNNASASGDRSGGTGVRQGRGSPALGAGRSRSVRVADAATSGHRSRAVAGCNLAAGGHASVADGAGGRACATLTSAGRVVSRRSPHPTTLPDRYAQISINHASASRTPLFREAFIDSAAMENRQVRRASQPR